MEVVVAEEKKKIFRARKTMKISDRQQLETLHNTLLTGSPSLSNPSPPLLNGTHKEDGQKVADKEQTNTFDSSSPHAASPVSPASRGSPAPSLSLNLSPSPPSSQSPKAKDETATSPISPFHSLNFELKKMEEEGMKGSSQASSNERPASLSTDVKEGPKKDTEGITEMEKKEERRTTTEGPAIDSVKDSAKCLVPPSPLSTAVSGKKSDKDHRPKPDFPEPMEIDNDTAAANVPEAKAPTAKRRVEKPPSPKATTSASTPPVTSPPCSSSSRPAAPSLTAPKQDQELKDEEDLHKEEMGDKKEVKKGSIQVEKMAVDSVKVETKKEKNEAGKSTKRSSTTPPDTVAQEKCSTSGLKRTLPGGSEKDGQAVERDGKRPKVDGGELEAQLELKITAKASSRLKLEKVVQQLVEEQLRVLQLTCFDKSLQELKGRVDKIDCATKHQSSFNTLQAKIARLAKKFGEANQISENKRKQEALATAAAVSAAASAAKTAAAASAAKTAAAATAAKTAAAAAAANPPPTQRPVRTPMEVKQTALATTSTTALTAQPSLVPTPTSTAIVQQAPILQLITSTSNAASTLATGITTQSSTGTLLLKTAPGSGMMATGQPLLIQLPLSMTNGQTGTLVNIPVSLATANSLNKAKATATTATFIFKPAPPITTVAASAPAAGTVPTLQAPTSQMSPAQISLARAVYQGGAGGITTPNAGVSVTTARTPAQSISVAGAMSSTSSPATSGPAATGSAAPGPPQGASMTSKTDNQATPVKAAAARPKGSVIDLTEDDDDVQVTGVKNATVAPPPATQRPHPVVSVPTSTGARSSPQSNQNSSNPSSPQVTVHHRPPVDSPMKSRAVTTTTPTRDSTTALPPLPPAPPLQGRLPPEAAQTSPPQQPELKLVPSDTGIVLSWSVTEINRTCAVVDSYHLYAFHQDNSNSNAAQQHWKKIGEVKALPLPMACTLTQFQSGSTYHFAVRAKDIYGRFGSFCEPQCSNVIKSSSN